MMRRPMPASRFARLAAAAAVATYVLIVAGGLVRATDSGLGCPDWPLCFGEWVPPPEIHAWIEHTHRLIAAIAVGPLVGLTALITVFSSRRTDRVLLIAAVSAGVLVIAQSVLGGLVVVLQLRAELVTAHLGMALTVLAATVFIAERAANGPPAASADPALRGSRRWAAALAAAIALQMLLGSWVTGMHAGLAFPDFPLMNGSIVPALGGAAELVQFAHRLLGVVIAALVVGSWRSVRRESVNPLAHRLIGAAAGLLIVQLALGAANVWSRLSALFVVPHLAVGAALWAVAWWLILVLRRDGAGASA